jgi:hypothetical protein
MTDAISRPEQQAATPTGAETAALQAPATAASAREAAWLAADMSVAPDRIRSEERQVLVMHRQSR